MKTFLLFTLASIITFATYAGDKKTVESTFETLDQKFTQMELETVSHLTITGTMNAVDFKFIKDYMLALDTLIISDVTIVEYKGLNGPFNSVSQDFTLEYSYAANAIPKGAFYSSSIQYIELPSKLEVIEEEAFESCSLMNSPIFPNTLTEIKEDAFKYCGYMEGELVFPVNLQTLGKYAFNECTSITAVKFPKTLQIIPQGAFFYCMNLKTIELPQRLFVVADSAFLDAPLSGDLELPNTLLKIGKSAFSGNECNKLILPASLYSIGDYAFEQFKGESIEVKSQIPLDLSNSIGVFSNTDLSVTKLIVPMGEQSVYSVAPVWMSFQNIEQKSTMELSRAYVEISNIGNEEIVSVQSNTEWNTSSSESWLSVSPLVNIVGNGNISFTAPINIGPRRNGKVTVIDTANNTKFIYVSQLDSIAFKQEVKDDTITVGDVYEYINLHDYFEYGGFEDQLKFYAYSTNEAVASAVIKGKYFGILPQSEGETQISIYAESTNGTYVKQTFLLLVKGPTIIDCDLTITGTVTNNTCYGNEDGSIEVSVDGGTAPYKYRWSNTRTDNKIESMPGGYYTVTVRDASGCIKTEQFNITEPMPMFASNLSKTLPDCGTNNGGIAVSFAGGTAPYSYIWSNGETMDNITNLLPGVYSLIVTDANGCEFTDRYSLMSPLAPSIIVDSLKHTPCNLNEGAAYISISGGAAPYEIVWSDGEKGFSRTGLAADTMYVKVQDANGCSSYEPIEIKSHSFVKPTIGLVTVSKQTGFNLIAWQKEESVQIKHYNIYREDPLTQTFEKIAEHSYSDLSVFQDDEVLANERSWRYKISAEDYCSVQSKLSRSFKTIHVEREQTTNGAIKLSWDDYEGELYPMYSIFRIINNDTVRLSRVSTNNSSYEITNPIGGARYYVGIEFPEKFDVKSSLLKEESGPFSLVMSNIAEAETSINTVSKAFSVYPTKTNNKITVSIPTVEGVVSIYNILGVEQIQKTIGSQATFSVANYPAGVYLVNVKYGEEEHTASIVVE